MTVNILPLLLILYLLPIFFTNTALAAPEFEFVSYPHQTFSGTQFDIDVNVTSLEANSKYYCKVIGGEVEKEVQTWNPDTQKWLNFTSSWDEFREYSPDPYGKLHLVLTARFKTETESGGKELSVRLRDIVKKKNEDSQTIVVNVTRSTPTPTPAPTQKPTPTLKPTVTAKPAATFRPEPTVKQVLSDQSFETPALYGESDQESYWDDVGNGFLYDNVEDKQDDPEGTQAKDYREKNAGDAKNKHFAGDKLNGKFKNIYFASYLFITGGSLVLSAGVISILKWRKKRYNLESDKNEDETLND